MKHKILITLLLLGMFLLTQFVGLFLIDGGVVPGLFRYEATTFLSLNSFFSLILSFIIAMTFFFFLIKYKWKIFLKIWFALVILLTLGTSINAIFFMNGFEGDKYFLFSLLIALPFVLLKIFRSSIIIHNLTEVFVYSGLSIIFVHVLTPITVILTLILISFYDMWAVWHSGLMQKMAKFQMNELKLFSGFLIPYLTKELKEKIKLAKEKKKNPKAEIRVSVALLGGGDIAFTLIPAGVFLKAFGWIPALFVVGGGFVGLTYLLFTSKKKRFYPAMPFISLAIFISLFIYGILFLL